MSAPAVAYEAVVNKSRFAAIINVTPGRVSQMISEGKISGEAIVGDGPKAQIRVAVAKAQLREKTDLGQRFGNGLATRIAPDPNEPPALSQADPGDIVGDQIKLEKLREIQSRNRRAAEDELERRGVYTRAADVRASMASLAASMLNVFEGGLADLATAISARFEIPQRDVLHLLRQEFRGLRAKAAEAARRGAAELPPLLVDDAAQDGDEG